WLDVPEVGFEEFVAGASAVFNFKIDHHGIELGVAYFRSEKPLPRPILTGEKGMYKLPVADISTENPVNFKAYIHLKVNQKFFLYLRNGRRLQPEQKQRLFEGDVRHIYMKSVDIENLRMFLAAAFLRHLIKNATVSDLKASA